MLDTGVLKGPITSLCPEAGGFSTGEGLGGRDHCCLGHMAQATARTTPVWLKGTGVPANAPGPWGRGSCRFELEGAGSPAKVHRLLSTLAQPMAGWGSARSLGAVGLGERQRARSGYSGGASRACMLSGEAGKGPWSCAEVCRVPAQCSGGGGCRPPWQSSARAQQNQLDLTQGWQCPGPAAGGSGGGTGTREHGLGWGTLPGACSGVCLVTG